MEINPPKSIHGHFWGKRIIKSFMGVKKTYFCKIRMRAASPRLGLVEITHVKFQFNQWIAFTWLHGSPVSLWKVITIFTKLSTLYRFTWEWNPKFLILTAESAKYPINDTENRKWVTYANANNRLSDFTLRALWIKTLNSPSGSSGNAW